jgi:hypothetical protein
MGDTVDLVGSGKRDRGRYLEVSRACFLVAVVVRHAQADAISGNIMSDGVVIWIRSTSPRTDDVAAIVSGIILRPTQVPAKRDNAHP